jgi:hypothetical protein
MCRASNSTSTVFETSLFDWRERGLATTIIVAGVKTFGAKCIIRARQMVGCETEWYVRHARILHLFRRSWLSRVCKSVVLLDMAKRRGCGA